MKGKFRAVCLMLISLSIFTETKKSFSFLDRLRGALLFPILFQNGSMELDLSMTI